MPNNRGVIHLLPLILLAALATGFIWFLKQGGVRGLLPKKEPDVSLQTEYKNPLSKESQYVNPFSSYKNPWDGLR